MKIKKEKITYVYIVYDKKGKAYIGARSHENPYNDTYMGSYKDKTFKPVRKIIIQLFASKEEAYKYEMYLHKKYQVDKNPKFANKSRCYSHNIYIRDKSKSNNPFFGKQHKQVTKEIVSAAMLGNKNRVDTQQYMFIHKDGRSFEGSREQFKAKFNFNKNSDCLFRWSGTTYTYKGWRVACLIK